MARTEHNLYDTVLACVSNFVAQMSTKDDGLFLTTDFWIQNMANPVLFEHSTKLLLQENGNFKHLFIEVAGREVLSSVVQQVIHGCGDTVSQSVATVQKGSSTELHATQFSMGVSFNWRLALGSTLGSRDLRLPNYSWNHVTPYVPAFINKLQTELEVEPIDKQMQSSSEH